MATKNSLNFSHSKTKLNPMKRRDFIRTTAAGTAFVATSGWLAASKANAASLQTIKYCYQSEREIPVAYKVDVVVIGGSSAAVAAAVTAAQKGASVWLTGLAPSACSSFSQRAKLSASSRLVSMRSNSGRAPPVRYKVTDLSASPRAVVCSNSGRIAPAKPATTVVNSPTTLSKLAARPLTRRSA